MVTDSMSESDVAEGVSGGGGASSSWCARDISLRAQKKLLSRVGNAAAARALILDDTAARVLEQLVRVLRARCPPRDAERLVKHVIKAAVKLAVLRRHGVLTPADERALETFRAKFHTVLMAVVSFCEVEFSYERVFLQAALHGAHLPLKSIVERHLTQKSVSRLQGVFAMATSDALLDALFAGSPARDVHALALLLRRALDQGLL